MIMPDSIQEIFTEHYKKNLEVAARKYASTFRLVDGELISTDPETYLKEVGGEGPSLVNQTETVSSSIRVGKDGKRLRVKGYTRKTAEKSLEAQLNEVRVPEPFLERIADDAFNLTVDSSAFQSEVRECIQKELKRR